MQIQNIRYDRRFLIALSVTGFLALITLGIFLFGNSTLVTFLSNYAIPSVSLVHMVITILFWKYAKDHKLTEKIFRLFAVGFVLWAIAEVLWLVFILLEQDPYPSIADLFWVIGYFPIILALNTGYKALRVRPTREHLQIIYTIIFAALAFTAYYIFLPILQDYAPGLLLVSLLNLAYPLLDFIILSQILFLFFILEKSRFKIPWLILAIGFAIIVLADLGFSFADWNGLYDAEQGNYLSRMVDWGYLINYPTLSLGIYAYSLVFAPFLISPRQTRKIAGTQKFTNTNIVFFISKDNLVIDVSNNFLDLMQSHNKEEYLSQPFGEILGLESARLETIVSKISEQGYVTDVPFQFKNAQGDIFAGWLSGLAMKTPGSSYNGASMVIRTHIKGAIPNKDLSEYHQSIALNIFNKASVQLPDFAVALHQYFSSKLQMLLKLIDEYNGDIVLTSVSSQLNNLASENSQNIKISNLDIWVDEESQVENIIADFPPILAAAEKEAARLTSKSIVEERIKVFDAQTDAFTLAIVDDYDLR